MTDKECCGKCISAQYFWRGCRKQYYCQMKLQAERQKSGGDERNSYIKFKDKVCGYYFEIKKIKANNYG